MNTQLLKAFFRSKKSVYWLAQQTGLSQRTIGQWTKGESSLLVKNAEKIASALGVKLKVEK